MQVFFQFFLPPASEFCQVMADPAEVEEDCAGVRPLPSSGGHEEEESGTACCDATPTGRGTLQPYSRRSRNSGLNLWVVVHVWVCSSDLNQKLLVAEVKTTSCDLTTYFHAVGSPAGASASCHFLCQLTTSTYPSV